MQSLAPGPSRDEEAQSTEWQRNRDKAAGEIQSKRQVNNRQQSKDNEALTALIEIPQ